jgi:hypothetical protein
MTDEQTAQIPPAGTAIPQADGGSPAAPGPAAPCAGAQSSTEKVEAAIAQILASKPAPVQAFLGPLLAGLNLPEEATQLDQLLLEGANFLLSLRSDGAEVQYTISTGAPAPTVATVPPSITQAVANVQQAVNELAHAVTVAAQAPGS